MSDKPRICLITTGGTIASLPDPATGAVRAAASGDELLAAVPDLTRLANIESEPFASVNGWNMTPEMMFHLAQRVAAILARPEITGAVITHGTDTVEETAFLLDLVLQSAKPVVFAVAMRHLAEPGSDAPRNLLDAVRVAVAPEAAGRGPLLVCNETIHAARYVTKVERTNPAAFASPDYGPAGLIRAGQVRLLHPPSPRTPLAAAELEPNVFLHTIAAGADDRPLRWALAAGYRGIVLEGTGAGNVPAAVVPGIADALAAGTPVVLTSRVPGGFLAPIYGSGGASGGGHDLVRLGVIPAPHLPAWKARIKLMVALGVTRNIAEIRALFAED